MTRDHSRRMGGLLCRSHGVAESMKITISIDDSLMSHADKVARDLGLTRSGLIAAALVNYLQQRERVRIRKQLNGVDANRASLAESCLVRKLRQKLNVQDRW